MKLFLVSAVSLFDGSLYTYNTIEEATNQLKEAAKNYFTRFEDFEHEEELQQVEKVFSGELESFTDGDTYYISANHCWYDDGDGTFYLDLYEREVHGLIIATDEEIIVKYFDTYKEIQEAVIKDFKEYGRIELPEEINSKGFYQDDDCLLDLDDIDSCYYYETSFKIF